MKKNGMVFERHEKKYMVTPDRCARLLEALGPHMEQDRYGLHTICTVYLDTDDFSIIRRSLEKPAFKEKLRLRSYGVPAREDTVYLELKKKLDHVTYKRRVPLTLGEAQRYLEGGIPPVLASNQVFGEIDWFVRQHQPSARVLLSYDRIALFGREEPNLRLTLDTDIRWRDRRLDLAQGDFGAYLLPRGVRLMEIKMMGALPLWLCSILSELELYPASFSKYGTVYANHLAQNRREVLRHAG